MTAAGAAKGWWLAGLLGLAGCDRVTTAIEDKAQQVAEDFTPEAAEPRANPLSEQEQLERKLALFLECTDRASARIRQSWQRFEERVQPSGTPRKKDQPPFLYKIDSELTPCIDAARKGPQTTPPLPEVEQAMADYVEYAETFAALSVDLDTYYEQKGYTQDDWARSKELTPAITAAFQAWSEAAQRLEPRLDALRDEVDRGLLAAVEERKGRGLEWHARTLVLSARALSRCLLDPEGDDECTGEHEALTTAHDQLEAICERDPARAEAVFWLGAFRHTAQRHRERADQRMASRRKDKAESDRRLQRALAALVSDARNLRFER